MKNKENKNENVDVEVELKSINEAIPGFDLDRFVATPLDTGITVKPILVTIPVRKPNQQTYFRIKPDFAVNVWLFMDKNDSDRQYLVDKNKVGLLTEQVKLNTLYLGVNSKLDPFLFPVRQPDETGNLNEWHKAQQTCVDLAKKTWIRMVPNRSIQGYDPIVAEGKLPEPEYPDLPISEIFQLAFKDLIIDDLNHPVVKRLRGLI